MQFSSLQGTPAPSVLTEINRRSSKPTLEAVTEKRDMNKESKMNAIDDDFEEVEDERRETGGIEVVIEHCV